MDFGRFVGFYHPALVHFPLVLLLVSFGMDVFGYFRRDTRFSYVAQILLVVGAVSMLFAFVAGNFAELWAARSGVPQDPMELHEFYATITSWSFVFLTAIRLGLGTELERNRSAMAAYLLGTLIACTLLVVTGHHGAMLVYDRGAGTQALSSPPIPTHEDLKQLTLKQDADDIFYSNKMHHIFGWLILVLSTLLVIDTISPTMGERLRKVGPILLLAGGVYLMIFSDTDSWPLSHIRPVTDKEVLIHKTYATLMLIIGFRGLFRGRGSAKPTRQMQNRAMAIFALVGGALLFTHVHSGAAYGNIAVGVYIHHTVMGFLALGIGTVKLLEDALPNSSPLRKMGFKWAYPALMILESLLLINYNEGLPWFLGYGDMSVSAPHHGLISHMGDDRAELTFDRPTGTLNLYLLHRDNDNSLPVPARSVQALVRVGNETTLVTLNPATPAAQNDHFAGVAAFLHEVPLFQVQALVPQEGIAPTAKPLVADFEPVVDMRMASAHTSRLAFVCPMHPEVGSSAPGTCPQCGMALIPRRPARPANQLHDPNYRMDLALSTVPAPAGTPDPPVTAITQPNAGQPVLLTLTPRKQDGSVVSDLAVVHTKKLHLIVASKDLSFFDHVHPVPQPNGMLTLEYTFPQPGDYLLYADITPAGDRNQVFRIPVTVAGTPPAPQPLVVTPAQAKLFGDYHVSLRLSPTPPPLRDETYLTFSVTRAGVPVTDLEPYLGAGGHCVILSEDTQSYLHSHPAEMGGTRFGPDITFHTVFPHPGKYKVWGQFQHQGKPFTADFVIAIGK